MTDVEFSDNRASFRYEACDAGELVSQIDYTIDGEVKTFTHTATPPQHRGRGLGQELTRWALDDVRAHGGKVVPLCSYTAAFIASHSPEYDDLVRG